MKIGKRIYGEHINIGDWFFERVGKNDWRLRKASVWACGGDNPLYELEGEPPEPPPEPRDGEIWLCAHAERAIKQALFFHAGRFWSYRSEAGYYATPNDRATPIVKLAEDPTILDLCEDETE